MQINKDLLYVKAALIFGYSLLLSSLLIILISPSSMGYEYNIYQVYPNYFWNLLVLSLFLGQCILIYYSFSRVTNRLWIAGLILIVITNFILIFMPLIRGYFSFEDEDVFTHIGMMKDIVHNGFIGISNIYPINHVLGSMLSLISGLNLHTITLIIPGFFSILFMLGFYLFLKNVFPDRSRLLCGLSFALILYYGRTATIFVPNGEAYLLLPLILYLIIRSLHGNGDVKLFILLSLILGIAIVFWHPLITVCLLVILGILFCLQQMHMINTSIYSNKFTIPSLMLIIFCIFLSWNAYLTLSVTSAQPILESIAGVEGHTSTLQHYSTLASSANVPFVDIVRLIMDVYGQVVILILTTIFCSAIYLSAILRSEDHIKIETVFSLCAFSVFLLFSLFLFLMGGAFGYHRTLLMSVLFSPVIIAVVWKIDLSNLLCLNQKYVLMLKTGFILIVLLSTTFFSTYNLYYSPIVKYPNDQVSESVFVGVDSFFKARDENLVILEYGLSQFRYYSAIRSDDTYKNVGYYGVSNLAPIDHFGYWSYNSITDAYGDDCYLLVTIRGKLFYQEIYPDYKPQWRFGPDDFIRLDNDFGAHRLYYGGNLEIYLIQ